MLCSSEGVAVVQQTQCFRGAKEPDYIISLGRYDNQLAVIILAGERCDVETLEWAKRSFGVPVLDHWWQTALGS
ncbi:hypothetical protein INR49_005056 [Caranx melampygus]|nr:hypothetical protein INR49_005056 [Caranx melampygus]